MRSGSVVSVMRIEGIDEMDDLMRTTKAGDVDDLFALDRPKRRPEWCERRDLVASIRGFLAVHYGDPDATKRLIPYITDEKWEVRAEVASAMTMVCDRDLAVFLPLLTDYNNYVAGAAKFAMDRRNITAKDAAKQDRSEAKLFRNIEKLRKTYGAEVAELALKDIENAYELTVGYAAHDIRGILDPIVSDLETMCSAASDYLPSSVLVRMNQCRQNIDSRIEMLLRMVDDMQTLAKKTPPERMSEDLREILLAAVGDVLNMFKAKNRSISQIEFNTDGIPDDITVRVERQNIFRSFKNLIKNAVESYMPSSGVFLPGTVEISAKKQPDGAEVTIRDYGMGMTETELKQARLFLPRSTSKKKTGSGLGMAIAFGKIKDHGGTLNIESEGRGKGVTVTVYLPFDGGTKDE